MNVLLGWNIQTIIIVTSVAIVLYSMLGGMKAVIWTEAIQGIILIGGALVCMFILLLTCPKVRHRLSPSLWKMENSAWEVLEAV